MDNERQLQGDLDAENCVRDQFMGAAVHRPQRSLSESSSGSSSSGGCKSSGSTKNGISSSSSSSSSSNGSSSIDSESSDNENTPEDPSANPEHVQSEPESETNFRLDGYFREKYPARLAIEFKSEWPEIEADIATSQPSLMRVPNFMPFNPKPYEMLFYKNEATQEELSDCESRDAFLTKLKTTVRWRETQNSVTGELVRESNARIVRWSDGSETFHVGAEAFDVYRLPLNGDVNQFYLRSGNYYKAHCPINENITLRPKLESSFGISHVQEMRKRAIYKPATNGVKLLTDFTGNPVVERGRKIREESVQLRRGNQRRESSVKPLQHYAGYYN